MSRPLTMVNTVGLTRSRKASWWVRLVWWNRERKARNPSIKDLQRQLLLLQIQETQMRTNALIYAENERFGSKAVEMGTGSLESAVEKEIEENILAACEAAMAGAEPVRVHPELVAAQARPQVYTGEEDEIGHLDEPVAARARA